MHYHIKKGSHDLVMHLKGLNKNILKAYHKKVKFLQTFWVAIEVMYFFLNEKYDYSLIPEKNFFAKD